MCATRVALLLKTHRGQELSGYTFLVVKELSQKAGAIKIDMTPYGFAISSEVQVGGGGGGCGGSCSSC